MRARKVPSATSRRHSTLTDLFGLSAVPVDALGHPDVQVYSVLIAKDRKALFAGDFVIEGTLATIASEDTADKMLATVQAAAAQPTEPVCVLEPHLCGTPTIRQRSARNFAHTVRDFVYNGGLGSTPCTKLYVVSSVGYAEPCQNPRPKAEGYPDRDLDRHMQLERETVRPEVVPVCVRVCKIKLGGRTEVCGMIRRRS